MKRLVIIVAIVILSGNVLADEIRGKGYLGIKGGLAAYAGDIGGNKFASYYDFNTGYWITDYLALGFNYGKGFLSASENLNSGERYFKTWLWNYTFLLKYKFLPKNLLNPYITAGYSIIDINPKGRNGLRLPNRRAEVYEKINYAIPLGIGFSYFIYEYLAVDFEAIYHYSGTDYLDDLDTGSRNDGWTTTALGLAFHFGKAKDTDKDGIPDKQDADPLHAEDFDGFRDEDGAPDPDNDGDGILDIWDKEPLKAEDTDGYRDKDGVPDPDNDGDGIPDVDDKCPGDDTNLNTKEDFDGFQDDDGCPDPDNDGDGILDADDQCPDEAEVFNDYEDDDGCPDEKPEMAVEKGEAIVLEGITFASGSANLTASSRNTLDKVYRTLKENPEIVVEIRGYTDNIGNYEYNVRLSKQRADAVKTYLFQKGIDAYRIPTKGFGPADPIAPNTTPEGRAKNRRIEFFRIQ